MKISRCPGASLRLTEITCAVTCGEGVAARGDARLIPCSRVRIDARKKISRVSCASIV